MKNKVITMCSKDYFQFGQKLLDTRHIVDADFVCYGPDLTEDQIGILMRYNIKYKKVNQDIWNTWMQSLKFQFIKDEIDSEYDGITFVDWDTYFLNDWGWIFYRTNWNIGITVRKEWIEANKTHRGWANGGVIFAKNKKGAMVLCEFALDIIENGGSSDLLEYDEIWKTLEMGRKPEKTHYRTDKRWWCDQVFLSALTKHKINNPWGYYDGDDYFLGVELFDCHQYNNMWEETPDTYIMHLKEKSGAPKEFKDGKVG
jgi:hypothetical protein